MLVVSVLSSLCHGGGLFVRILEKGGDRAYKALLNRSLGVMGYRVGLPLWSALTGLSDR
jgi:hypothetical protein